nr:EamA family transporter [Mesorhizobium atlanticum]
MDPWVAGSQAASPLLPVEARGRTSPCIRQSGSEHVSIPRRKGFWTIIGLLAVPLWALWPLMAVIASDSLPTFQFSAINYAVAASTLFLSSRRRPYTSRMINQQLVSILMVALGVLVGNVLFLYSLKFIAPAQSNVIVYLWPVILVVLATALGLMTFSPRHILSVLLALTGAVLVIGPDLATGSWKGVVLAFGSGLAWAVFCVYRIWQGPDAPDALIAGLTVSSVSAMVIHFMVETTTLPTPLSLFVVIFTGVFPLAVGALCWDYGLRRGDKVVLAVSAYATPLVSILILAAFGRAQLTAGILVGATLIVGGGLVSSRQVRSL